MKMKTEHNGIVGFLGGSKIMLGAGGSVEPFWSLYAIHKRPEVLLLMEQYRIGNLTKGEEKLATQDMEDPYANEPHRHPILHVHSKVMKVEINFLDLKGLTKNYSF